MLLYRQLGITAAAWSAGWSAQRVQRLLQARPACAMPIARARALGHPACGAHRLLYAGDGRWRWTCWSTARFSYNLASSTGEGSISYMAWATTLIQFPQGLVALAISVAILPTLSRQAVDRADVGLRQFKRRWGRLRLAIVLIIPATVGLFCAGRSVVALIFQQHGSSTQ